MLPVPESGFGRLVAGDTVMRLLARAMLHLGQLRPGRGASAEWPWEHIVLSTYGPLAVVWCQARGDVEVSVARAPARGFGGGGVFVMGCGQLSNSATRVAKALRDPAGPEAIGQLACPGKAGRPAKRHRLRAVMDDAVVDRRAPLMMSPAEQGQQQQRRERGGPHPGMS